MMIVYKWFICWKHSRMLLDGQLEVIVPECHAFQYQFIRQAAGTGARLRVNIV